jgi:hypothetical protein
MRVLHGMCYSLPAVVVISYLMWLTNSWASGIAMTNLLTHDSPKVLHTTYSRNVGKGIHCYRTTGTYPNIVVLLDYSIRY